MWGTHFIYHHNHIICTTILLISGNMQNGWILWCGLSYYGWLLYYGDNRSTSAVYHSCSRHCRWISNGREIRSHVPCVLSYMLTYDDLAHNRRMNRRVASSYYSWLLYWDNGSTSVVCRSFQRHCHWIISMAMNHRSHVRYALYMLVVSLDDVSAAIRRRWARRPYLYWGR